MADAGPPIGSNWDARTYRGVGPHPHDPRAFQVAGQVATVIDERRPGAIAEHVGSTAVDGLAGKNVVDLQITTDPHDLPEIVRALLSIGFSRQRGPDPWPPSRPMLEGTYRCDDAVFLVHVHVVPMDDPGAEEMIALRDRLRKDPLARDAYAAEKRLIAARTSDVRAYTEAKTDFIVGLLHEMGLRR